MPQALIFIAPATFGVGGSLALATAAGGLTALGIATSVAGSLLLTAAAGALNRPDQPKPENIQLTVRQSVGPRIRHYGLVRAGGTVVFFRTRGGFFYRVVVHGHGEIDGIADHILNKKSVEVDPGGWVLDDQYFVKDKRRVRILSRRGVVPEVHYGQISDIWPEWDASHRLDGLWTSLTIAEQVDSKYYRSTYPNNEPALELVARTSRVKDPRTGVVAYLENAAAVIGDLIEHPDGFNRPGRLHIASHAQAANDSDDAIPLAAGGTEPRYRLCGSYSLAERPQDVLQSMLDACAGEVSLRPDGTIGLRVGKRRPPTVTLTHRDVIGLAEFGSGPDQIDRYNELPFVYVDPTLEFTQTTGESWLDEGREAIDGETLIGGQLDLSFSPSHGQGRRVAKQRIARDNPAMTFTLHCHPRAIRALYEETVNLDLPQLGFVGEYRIRSYRADLITGGITYDLASHDRTSHEWSADEEGLPQTLPPENEEQGIPLPTGFTAAGAGVQASSNVFVAGITAQWDAPASDALSPLLQWRTSGEGFIGSDNYKRAGQWQTAAIDEGATSASISPLADRTEYDLRLTWQTSAGDIGTYVALTDVRAAAASDPPLPPTALTVQDDGSGDATIRLVASTSASIWKTQIFRDGALLTEVYANPGVTITLTDSVGPGTFSWTARSINISDVPSQTDAGPVTQTIT